MFKQSLVDRRGLIRTSNLTIDSEIQNRFNVLELARINQEGVEWSAEVSDSWSDFYRRIFTVKGEVQVEQYFTD